MKIDLYQVDAFASRVFEGNPAAVCPLESWLPDDVMQQIAMENNLSETAYFVKEEGIFGLRWFTPETEVDLCGHATLASAHVLFNHLNYKSNWIEFQTKSGELKVKQEGDVLIMDFPANQAREVAHPELLKTALGLEIKECYRSMDYLAVVESEDQVRSLNPDFLKLKKLDTRGIIVTAPGKEDDIDFVLRFFAPAVGINEDPVTGSAHTILTPYWAGRLGKNDLKARQVSNRGGDIFCTMDGERVELGGSAQTFLTGTVELPEQ